MNLGKASRWHRATILLPSRELDKLCRTQLKSFVTFVTAHKKPASWRTEHEVKRL